MVHYMRGPTPSGAACSAPRGGTSASTKASLLSRGSLPRYHAEHKPSRLCAAPSNR